MEDFVKWFPYGHPKVWFLSIHLLGLFSSSRPGKHSCFSLLCSPYFSCLQSSKFRLNSRGFPEFVQKELALFVCEPSDLWLQLMGLCSDVFQSFQSLSCRKTEGIRVLFIQAITLWLLFHHENSEPPLLFASWFYSEVGLFLNPNFR